MALSDCSKCWSTPCECGQEYKDWDSQRLKSLIEILTQILKTKG